MAGEGERGARALEARERWALLLQGEWVARVQESRALRLQGWAWGRGRAGKAGSSCLSSSSVLGVRSAGRPQRLLSPPRGRLAGVAGLLGVGLGAAEAIASARRLAAEGSARRAATGSRGKGGGGPPPRWRAVQGTGAGGVGVMVGCRKGQGVEGAGAARAAATRAKLFSEFVGIGRGKGQGRVVVGVVVGRVGMATPIREKPTEEISNPAREGSALAHAVGKRQSTEHRIAEKINLGGRK